jgi:hypothetical protein
MARIVDRLYRMESICDGGVAAWAEASRAFCYFFACAAFYSMLLQFSYRVACTFSGRICLSTACRCCRTARAPFIYTFLCVAQGRTGWSHASNYGKTICIAGMELRSWATIVPLVHSSSGLHLPRTLRCARGRDLGWCAVGWVLYLFHTLGENTLLFPIALPAQGPDCGALSLPTSPSACTRIFRLPFYGVRRRRGGTLRTKTWHLDFAANLWLVQADLPSLLSVALAPNGPLPFL